MQILVCVKRVPDTADAEVVLRRDGSGIEGEDLAWGISEWDDCAVEEAIRLKEAHGGTVTVATVGPPESEDVLRRCLAMGADEAVRVDDAPFGGPDPYAVARALRALAGRAAYDLILTGALSGDHGFGMVGPLLAGYLGWAHATLVTSMVLDDGHVRVTRELEGGLEESLRLPLPAVLTVQTGINEPRYVSIMGIRKVRAKEIPVLDAEGLGLDPSELAPGAGRIRSAGLSVPPAGKSAEMLQGTPSEIARRILHILREKGGAA